MWSILENVPCALEKKVYSFAFGWSVQHCSILLFNIVLEVLATTIREESKVAVYKINTHKSLAFLYTNNEKSEEKLRNQSHSPLQQKELNIKE